QLAAIFLDLQKQGVHNINLVSPTPYARSIKDAVIYARAGGLSIPVVYNTNAYESVDTVRMLRGVIDVYLPDLKYFDGQYAVKYSNAPGYFEAATGAILEMYAQAPDLELDSEGIAQKGLILRHLVMPGLRRDSMRILDWVKANVPQATVSLMRQYVPRHRAAEFREIDRKVTSFEYQSVIDYFFEIGLSKAFMQDGRAASEECIPDF
ncbi:MAG: radical SAM protein, partial [Defluviitaleaceae bacterium]|nr:radical SAM protein [Defluviitaleaceae bacterium]